MPQVEHEGKSAAITDVENRHPRNEMQQNETGKPFMMNDLPETSVDGLFRTFRDNRQAFLEVRRIGEEASRESLQTTTKRVS